MFVVWLWIKEAFFGLFRNIRWNLSAVFLSTACLFLFALSFTLGLNADHFAEMLDDKIEVKVYLLEEVTNYTEVEEKIKNLGNIESIEFVSKDAALENAKKEFGDDADIFDALDRNPLPASYVIKLKDTTKIEEFVTKIDNLKVAEQTEYGQGFVQKILVSAKTISKVGYGLTIFGVVFTLFVVFAAIQNNIMRRKNEIRIKQLVGASNLTIKIPFVLEAIILMLISSLIVYFAFYFGMPELMKMIKESIPYFDLVDTKTVLNKLAGPLLLLAVVIGFIGSSLSTYRNIKK